MQNSYMQGKQGYDCVSCADAFAVITLEFGAGTGAILLDRVDCVGSELNLTECRHSGVNVHNCNHSGDAAVICSGGSFVG